MFRVKKDFELEVNTIEKLSLRSRFPDATRIRCKFLGAWSLELSKPNFIKIGSERCCQACSRAGNPFWTDFDEIWLLHIVFLLTEISIEGAPTWETKLLEICIWSELHLEILTAARTLIQDYSGLGRIVRMKVAGDERLWRSGRKRVLHLFSVVGGWLVRGRGLGVLS